MKRIIQRRQWRSDHPAHFNQRMRELRAYALGSKPTKRVTFNEWRARHGLIPLTRGLA